MPTVDVKPYLVLIGGRKHSGKSEVRKYLVEQLNMRPAPFAEPLKDMIALLLRRLEPNMSEWAVQQRVRGDLKEAPLQGLGGHMSARKMMQTLGTEWGRNIIDPNLWVRAWLSDVRGQSGSVVADDARFHNEVEAAEALKDRFEVITLWVERPGLPDNLDPHDSEHTLTAGDFRHIVYNDGSLQELKDSVDRILRAAPVAVPEDFLG